MEKESIEFCNKWLEKAQATDDTTFGGAFDKLFTLYVAYNRLYTEATYKLANRGDIKLENRDYFPDAQAARDYVVIFLKSGSLEEELLKDEHCKSAINTLKEILEFNEFNIKLNPVTAQANPEADRDLLGRLNSESKDTRTKAITDFIYSVRCNAFHGQKSYEKHQLRVLHPVNTILLKLCKLLLAKLLKPEPQAPKV